ncbi:MAG: nitroreductase family deazaflavin-dependent oxidoreductase [Actinomycetota bacterium]
MSTALEPFRALAAEPHAYLTTIGRRSGEPHEIEIWWAFVDGVVYMISGGGDASDWVRNLQAEPTAAIRVGDTSIAVRARFELTDDERTSAGGALAGKYRPGESSWRDGFLVAYDGR